MRDTRSWGSDSSRVSIMRAGIVQLFSWELCVFADGWLLAYRLMAWGRDGCPSVFALFVFSGRCGTGRVPGIRWFAFLCILAPWECIPQLVVTSAICAKHHLWRLFHHRFRSVIANLLACIAGHLHPFPYLCIRRFCQ